MVSLFMLVHQLEGKLLSPRLELWVLVQFRILVQILAKYFF
jgi:hypothetical protein